MRFVRVTELGIVRTEGCFSFVVKIAFNWHVSKNCRLCFFSLLRRRQFVIMETDGTLFET